MEDHAIDGPDRQALTGRYHHDAIGTIVVSEEGENLVGRIPGVPDGFEIPMTPLETYTWKLHRGFLEGLPVQFDPPDGGSSPAFTLMGQTFRRLAPDEQPHSPLRTLPPLADDPQRDASFERLYQQALASGPAARIDYDLPYPRHEFLRYLAQAYQPIFHGSTKTDITRFEPRRRSVELYDETGRGNLAAVYGTHIPVWSMFFAVIDRNKGRGVINNGVFLLENAAGETLEVYQFAVSADLLAADPWAPGMLYILPAETFERLQAPHGQPLNEWASRQPVVPFASLPVQPEDFPFLQQVGGYRDPVLERLDGLSDRLNGHVRQARLAEDSVELTLDWDAELPDLLESYFEIMGRVFPQVRLSYERSQPGSDVLLEVRGPEAYMQTLEDRLQERGLLS